MTDTSKLKIKIKLQKNKLYKMQISSFPDKEFKFMVIKMLTELEEEWMNTVRSSTKRRKDKST